MHGMCAVPRHESICGGTPERRAGQIHVHATHSPRAVSVQAPVVLRLLPSAVHILFRARPAVQSAYDANSTFVIRPDALAGFAAALLVPRYVAGVRGVEEEKRSFPSAFTGEGPAVCCGRAWRREEKRSFPSAFTREDGSITPFAHASTGREDASITSPASLASRP